MTEESGESNREGREREKGEWQLKLQGGDNVNGQQTDILGSCCYTFHLTHALARMMYKCQLLQTVI